MYCYTPYGQCGPTAPYESYSMPQTEYMYGAGEYPMPEYAGMGYMKPYLTEKYKKCVKVPEVIGRNYTQIMLETVIPFPCNYPALEIKDIMKDVTGLVMSVCKDKVLINGKLHKNINYKTLESVSKTKCKCEELDIIYGNLKHVSVTIPFSGYIEVPGALPGDEIEVEYAGVEDLCEMDILEHPYYGKCSKVPVYKKVREKDIVKIEVKVLRHTQITVNPECPNICP